MTTVAAEDVLLLAVGPPQRPCARINIDTLVVLASDVLTHRNSRPLFL